MRFWTVFKGAAVGAAQLDMQGHFILSNAALQRMFGYEAGELERMSFTELAHPEEGMKEGRFFIESLIAGKKESYQTEKRFLCRDGRAMWGRLTLSLVPGRKGHTESVIGIVDDITHLKRAERVCQVSKARYWRVLESASDGIIIVNHGRIVFINIKAEAMFGYGLEELLGKPLEILLPERYRRTH
ncbi:MAG TPA: PAS domain S-box protein, partial [Candidatus Manganitrophaceae bacterium]|nr:PAS domain S-box protein [Candidatus Manganitrophaceae bacterium]